MALLYRFTKLNDRNNTGIFTFIVTRTVTRDLHRDATTKDFYYGYHRWAISFTRANDKSLSVFLILRNPSPSTECYTDYTLTLLNREHFSRNEQYTEKQCKFTVDRTTQGVSKWLLLSEIQSRKFGDETGEFLLELSLGNILTNFKTDLQVSNGTAPLKSGKFESATFNFGQFDWNVSIVVHNYGPTTGASATNSSENPAASNGATTNGSSGNDAGNAETASSRIIYVFLNRLSGFDHPCRVQYKVIIGEGKNREDSGLLDQISDAGGRIRGFQMQHSLTDLMKPNGTVRVYVELHCCNSISEAKVPIIRNPSPNISCYDRNKQGWCVEADVDSSEFVRLKLFFMDLHSVPRNHLRYISWIAYIIARDPRNGLRESIAVANSPHSNYYIQDGIDMGAMMDTTLPVSKIKESPKIYLETDNKLTVHIEWCDSIMLFNHVYHKYDDICRIHCHQMRREINALSNENYSLEKQLMSYQKSVRSSSKDNASDTGSQQSSHGSHLNRKSSSEMQLNENGGSTGNVRISMHHQQHSSYSGSGGVSHSHSVERRPLSDTRGNGSMLGLPTNSNCLSGNLISPAGSTGVPVPGAVVTAAASANTSPLATSRNHHQGFHHHHQQQQQQQQQKQQQQMTRPGHHQLPAIPNQSSSSGSTPSSHHHHSSAFYTNSVGSPQVTNRFHYGSLPSNSFYDSVFDEDDDYTVPEQVDLSCNMTPNRIVHRSSLYDRCRSKYASMQHHSMMATSHYAITTNMVNNFGQSMPTLSQHHQQQHQQPPHQLQQLHQHHNLAHQPHQIKSYPMAGGTAGAAGLMQQTSIGSASSQPPPSQHMAQTNGWIGNGTGAKVVISPGSGYLN